VRRRRDRSRDAFTFVDDAGHNLSRGLCRLRLHFSRQTTVNWNFPPEFKAVCRQFYAALATFDDVADHDALAVLAIAPTPAQGAGLTQARVERHCVAADADAT